MKKVKIRVPATTANIGPGFDTLGCALRLYNYFTFSGSGDELSITGCDEKYAGADNLAYVSYIKALNFAGFGAPKGLNIHISGDVPISRGLGSSSTLTVAGVMASNEIHSLGLSKNDVLKICTAIEGHPDNVAPAIFGGLVASLYRDGEVISLPYEVSPDIKFTALVPDFELSTEMARAILPHEIPRSDAVYTVSCLGILLKALETGDRNALSLALNDKLHEPYRKTLICGYNEVRSAVLSAGYAGLVISGSGSTLLAVGGGMEKNEKLQEKLRDIPGSWRVLPLEVDKSGAIILEVEQGRTNITL